MSRFSLRLAIFSAATLVVIYMLFAQAVSDDALALRSLSVIAPLIDNLNGIGKVYLDNAEQLIPWISSLAALLCFLLLWRCGYIILGLTVSVAIVGQSLFLFDHFQLALGAYCISLFFGILGVYKTTVEEPSERDCNQLNSKELSILFGIVVLASIYRVYAINHHFDYFEGELSPYSAGATSLRGIPIANKGIGGPWAPLGILYYLPIYLTTNLFGTTLPALRLSSAFVGILTVPLVYLLMRRIAGSAVGLVSSFLFALNALHIGWSRTDVHPHGVTTWPTLLLCWATIGALTTQKRTYYLLTAFLMGLTWHQYPSGQSAVAIPVFAVALYWFINGFRLPCRISSLGWIGLGIVLWLLGLPLSYYLADGEFWISNPFTLTTQRTSWGNTTDDMGVLQGVLFVVHTAWTHGVDVLESIFVKAPYLFHQDFVPEVLPFTTRTVPWLLVPFGVFGLLLTLRRAQKPEYVVLVAWLIVGLLPGILSEHAYPKRLSTVFPLIDCLGALGLVWIVTTTTKKVALLEKLGMASLLAAVFIWFAGFSSAVWFEGHQWKFGEPPEVAIYKSIEKQIEPKTIIITDMWKDYDEGKALYLLLDALTAEENRPNLVFFSRPDVQGVDLLIPNPRVAPEVLERRSNSWWYDWTKLRYQYRESIENKDWKYVLFILQERADSERSNIENIKSIQDRCQDPVISRIPDKGSFRNAMIVLRCTLQ